MNKSPQPGHLHQGDQQEQGRAHNRKLGRSAQQRASGPGGEYLEYFMRACGSNWQVWGRLQSGARSRP